MSLHPDIERLALLGWHLVPVARRARKGLWKGYLADATHDLDTLDRWQREYPGCNWAVVPGPSGVWALDVDIDGEDHASNGVDALRDLCAAHGPLPRRPHGRSGGGGHLLVFRQHPGIVGGSGKPAPGIDALANRQQFTVSPSRHRRTGDPYRWVVAPWECSPPAAPEWLVAMLTPPPRPPLPKLTPRRATDALDRVLRDLARAGQGGRNAALNRAAFIAGRFAAAGMLAESEAVSAIYHAGRHIGLDDAECRATIRSGWQSGIRNPASLH